MTEFIHSGRQTMPEISMHIRHGMFYQFQLGNNASADARHICTGLGKGAVADRICPDWFKKFRENDMSLKDRPRLEHLPDSDIERIEVLIEDNSRLTICELSSMLGCNQSTIDCHLQDLGKVDKLETWLPHQLTSDNIQQTITICSFFLSKCYRHRYLQQIVTGDEKWILYVDHRRKRQ